MMKKTRLSSIIAGITMLYGHSVVAEEALWQIEPMVTMSSMLPDGTIGDKIQVPTRPIRLNKNFTALLNNKRQGETISLPIPEKGIIEVSVKTVSELGQGRKSLIGTYVEDGKPQDVVITFNKDSLYVSVNSSREPYEVIANKKETHIRKQADVDKANSIHENDGVEPPSAQDGQQVTPTVDEPYSANDGDQSFVTDTDGDGVTDAVESILNTDPNNPASVDLSTQKIQLLALYNQSAEDLYGGDPITRILHLVNTANTINANSGIRLQYEVVGTQKVNQDQSATSSAVLSDMYTGKNEFYWLNYWQNEVNADAAVMFRPSVNDGTCGIAYIGGWGTSGDMSNSKPLMRAHVSINCADYVLSHELGHNLGLRHSRLQDTTGGTTGYALGHGEDDDFVTVMAYPTSFNGATKNNLFANKDLTCRGKMGIDRPCGVDKSDVYAGADAVYVMNITAPQVARFASLDTDKDGLSDELEGILGTDPNKPDTDDDDMPDKYEVDNKLNPKVNDANADLDSDGLSNIDEYNLKTLPNVRDTDGDGLSDGDEVHLHATNPLARDSDNDKMSDGYEVRFHLDPGMDDANIDSDGDGYFNIEEYNANVDPKDKLDYPDKSLDVQITEPLQGKLIEPGELTLSFDLSGWVLPNSSPKPALEVFINGYKWQVYGYPTTENGSPDLVNGSNSAKIDLPAGDFDILVQINGTKRSVTSTTHVVIGYDPEQIPVISVGESTEDGDGNFLVNGDDRHQLTLHGSAIDGQDGDITSQLQWILNSQSSRPNTLDGPDSALFEGSGSEVTLPALAAGNYLLTLSAEDSDGIIGRKTVQVIISEAPPLPEGWAEKFWGLPKLDNAATYDENNAIFSLLSVGKNIGSSYDDGHFAFTEIQGNFELVAKIDSILGDSNYAGAGIMVRSSLEQNAANAYMYATVGYGTYFQYRKADGSSTSKRKYGTENVFAPQYLKLIRNGTMVSGFVSSTGDEGDWTLVYEYRVALPNNTFIGLAGFSKYDYKAIQSSFSKWEIKSLENTAPVIDLPGDPLFGKVNRDLMLTSSAMDVEDGNISSNQSWALDSLSNVVSTGTSMFISGDSGLTEGDHTLFLSVTDSNGVTTSTQKQLVVLDPTKTLDAGWLTSSIGTEVSTDGMFLYDGKYHMEATGYNMGGYADEGYFASKVMNGNFVVTAFIDDIQKISSSTTFGLMARESTDPGSKNAFAFNTADYGSGFQYRKDTDGTTRKVTVRDKNPGLWLKLERVGEWFIASQSLTGDPDSYVEISRQSIQMKDELLVGIAGFSKSRSKAANATISNLVYQDKGNKPPVLTLTAATTQRIPLWAYTKLTAIANDPETSDITSEITWALNSATNVIDQKGGEIYLDSSTGLVQGINKIYAKAIDQEGASTTATYTVELYNPEDELGGDFKIANIGSTAAIDNNVSLAGGEFNLRTSSYRATGYSDEVFYLFNTTGGSFELIASVDEVVKASTYSGAGLMIRSSLAADSANAMLYMTADYGVQFQARLEDGKSTSTVASDRTLRPGSWLKMARTGQYITAYTSPDGTPGSWTELASKKVLLPDTVFTGIAAQSAYRGKTATVTMHGYANTSLGNQPPRIQLEQAQNQSVPYFSNLNLSALAWDPETGDISANQTWALDAQANIVATGSSVTLSSLPLGQHDVFITSEDVDGAKSIAKYHIESVDPSAQLPGGWSLYNIGDETDFNYLAISGDDWTIKTNSYKATSSKDNVMFMAESISGDFDISLHVDSIEKISSGTGVGLMARETTDIGSRNLMLFETASSGTTFQSRNVENQSTYTLNRISGDRPAIWLRLARTGNEFSSYTSIDGIEWTLVGSKTLDLNTALQVGIGAFSAYRDRIAEIHVSKYSRK